MISKRKTLNEIIEKIEDDLEDFDGTIEEMQEKINLLSSFKKERNSLKHNFSGTIYIDDNELEYYETEHLRDLVNNNGKIFELEKDLEEVSSYRKKHENDLKIYYELIKNENSIHSILNHIS